MTLHNKNGEALEAELRPFRSEDASQIIACIRDAYGDTYVKPYLYTEEGIRQHEEEGSLCFSVAEAPGGIVAGITAYALSDHFPAMAEIACQIIRREYNGYGLALPLALHAMGRAEELDLSAQYARALGCHLISQKTLDGMGFTACGFLLNVFDKDLFAHRFENGDYAKIPQSIAVKRQNKTDVGAVWLPDRLVPIAEAMYKKMGLAWTHRESAPDLSGPDLWNRELDENHAALSLRAETCGADFEKNLAEAVRERLDANKEHTNQTINLFLNLSRPGSAAAYEIARRLGFFFTGFLPSGKEGEYMILHHPLQTPVRLDEMPHIPEYAPFIEEMRRCAYK